VGMSIDVTDYIVNKHFVIFGVCSYAWTSLCIWCIVDEKVIHLMHCWWIYIFEKLMF